MSNMMGTNLKSQTVGDVTSVTEDNTATMDEEGARIVKRPMNAYMLWYMQKRRKMAVDVSKMRIGEVSKRLGREWRLLSNAEKKPFLDEAKRLKAELRAKYPNYKFKPKQKLPASQKKDSYSLPGTPTASNANSSPCTFFQRINSHFNGWSNGPYGPVQQLDYMQQPGLSSSQVQPLQRYDLNRLCFNPMPSAEAYMDSSAMYNIPAPCSHNHPMLMAMGSIVAGVEFSPQSPVIAPHIQSGYLTDMIGMYVAPSGNGNDPSGFQNSRMPSIHPHYQAAATALNGNVYQNYT